MGKRKQPRPVKSEDSDSIHTACLTPSDFYRLTQAQLNTATQEAFIRHINRCSRCFSDLIAYLKILEEPTAAGQVDTLHKNRQDLEKQITQILEYIHADLERQPRTVRIREATRSVWWSSYEAIHRMGIALWKSLHPPDALWQRRPQVSTVLAIAVLLVVVLAFFLFMQKQTPVKYVAELIESEPLYYKHPRLSGNFPIGLLSRDFLSAEPDCSLTPLEQAEEVLQAALVNGNSQPELLHQYARLLILEKKYGQADSLLAELIATRPDWIEILNDRGVARLMLQRQAPEPDYRSAIPFFEQVLEQDPDNRFALYNLYLISIWQDDRARAAQHRERLLSTKLNQAWRDAVNSLWYEFESK